MLTEAQKKVHDAVKEEADNQKNESMASTPEGDDKKVELKKDTVVTPTPNDNEESVESVESTNASGCDVSPTRKLLMW